MNRANAERIAARLNEANEPPAEHFAFHAGRNRWQVRKKSGDKVTGSTVIDQ